MTDIIRIDLGAEVSPGIWEYTAPSLRVGGRSRQPLLDACRQLKSLCAPTAQLAGLFREGRSSPDLTCSVEVGAATTVSEPDRGSIRLVPYRSFNLAEALGGKLSPAELN